MRIKGIDHIVITVSDINKAAEFYVGLLGMSLDMNGGRAALKFGSQKINLHKFAGEFKPAAKNPTFGSVDICLIADAKIEDIRNELIEKGVKFELDVVDRTGAQGAMKSLYLRDFDGNLVEISSYEI